jgi:hypothetical protein
LDCWGHPRIHKFIIGILRFAPNKTIDPIALMRYNLNKRDTKEGYDANELEDSFGKG